MKLSSQPEIQTDDQGSVEARIRESVSALMDGEVQELELRRLLTVEDQEIVDQTWRRYHLVRDALNEKEPVTQFCHLDVSKSVCAAIAEQRVPGFKAQRWWLRPVAGFAIAASVAAGVVIGVRGMDQPLPGMDSAFQGGSTVASSRVYPMDGSSVKASAGGGAEDVVNYQASPLPGAIAVSQKAADLEAQRRLDKYLLRHTESAALNNGQGIISFARVASFENQ